MGKYVIRVWLSNDSYLYVSEGPFDNLRTTVFDSLEDAESWVDMWFEQGHKGEVDILEIEEDD